MSQLQEYVDSQVATISPFKVKSQELLEQAKAKEVTDDATAKEAVAIRKLITSHRTEVKNARLAITRNFDSVKSQFIDKDELTTAERDEAEAAKLAAQRKREQEIAETEAAKAAKTQKPAVKSGIKTKTVFTVTNPELVPRSLCEPSDKLIREAIANGLREIPGVEIREEKSF